MKIFPAPQALSLLVFLGLGSHLAGASPADTTVDGSGAYATGQYRNLFAEAGHSSKEISARIDAAFQQLFRGNPETQAVYFPAGKNAQGPLAYLTDWNNHDVRTEGMSYGMMIAVQLDRKEEFDALWNWTKSYMYISDPRHPSFGYFSWTCKTDGSPNEETAAPDGEEYFVMSLYFAANRWGNGPGIYNYQAQADELLHTMRHRVKMSGPTKFGPRTVASEVDEGTRMIRFVPGVDRGNFTDPSYHLPAFYELWARWGPTEDRIFWAEAATANAGGRAQVHVAKWTGTEWTRIGRSLNVSRSGFANCVALAGSGNALYVAWQERGLAGKNQIYVKIWDGSAWSAAPDVMALCGIPENFAEGLVSANVTPPFSFIARRPRVPSEPVPERMTPMAEAAWFFASEKKNESTCPSRPERFSRVTKLNELRWMPTSQPGGRT